MTDLIADAPLQVLMGLLIMFVIGAILFGLAIVIIIARRGRNARTMAVGQAATVEADENPSFSLPEIPPIIARDADEKSPIEARISPDMSSNSSIDVPLPPNPTPELSRPDYQPDPSLEERLNLAVLSNDDDVEPMMTDMSRLANQPNASEDDSSSRLSSASPSFQSTESVELLRLLRDSRSGQLIVEIAGNRYAKLADIDDKKIGQFILKLAAHLLAFTNGVVLTDSGLKPVYKPTVGQLPMPIAQPSPVSQRSGPSPSSTPKLTPEEEAAFLTSLRAQGEPEKAESQAQFGFFRRASKLQEAPPPIPGLNLAEEINEIVQERLSMSPLAVTTAIEITADPDGGIRINVNGQYYRSPDAVPEQGARNLIKDSIKAWERS